MIRRFATLNILIIIFFSLTINIYTQYHKNFNIKNKIISDELKEKIEVKFREQFESIQQSNPYKMKTVSLGKVDSVFYKAWVLTKDGNVIMDAIERRRLVDVDFYNRTSSVIESDYNTSTGKYENATKTDRSHSGGDFNQKTHELVSNWDADQKAWVPDNETEFVDDLTEQTETYYEYHDGNKVPVWMTREYNIDDDNKEKLLLVYEDGDWKYSSRTQYIYDGINLVEKVEQIWNSDTNSWENLERETKSYNDQGKEENYTTYYWDGADWQNEMYGENDYNQDGNLSRTTISYWYGSAWEYLARTIYSYLDPSGIVQSLIDMSWDDLAQAWNNDWSTYYSYNSDYQLTQDLLRRWNGSDWDYYSRDQYNYDANGNCTSGNADMYYNGTWEETYHPLAFQDGYGLYHYFLCAYFNAYFSEITTDINENELELEFSLSQNYPNPFNPTTSIKYQVPQTEMVSIKVYNILGSEISTIVSDVKSPGKYEVQFDASKLSSDVYFYKLTSGEYSRIKKMILLK